MSKTLLRSVKGMNDLFEPELVTWRAIEEIVRNLSMNFGYGEVRTPILEDVGVFKRGVGETTDIVEKEMYSLADGDSRVLCLRPENTASVVRALLQAGGLNSESEQKLFYFGPMFRRERPQKGRLRQFHQFGAEALGFEGPEADIEIMSLLYGVMKKLGITGLTFALNSLGGPAERKHFSVELRTYLERHLEELCDDCNRRMTKNLLRVLDCKNPKCKEIAKSAPKTLSFLSEASLQHFETVKSGLNAMAIPFEEDTNLVRGLDYYTHTVFELTADMGLGSQNAIAAGGRYNGLVATMGGTNIPAVGFSAGVERIILVLESMQKSFASVGPDVAFVLADPEALGLVRQLSSQLRENNLSADYDLKARSVKAQMRRANRLGAKNVLVVGKDELQNKRAALKRLSDGSTSQVGLDFESIRGGIS